MWYTGELLRVPSLAFHALPYMYSMRKVMPATVGGGVKRLRVGLLVMECHSVVWNRGGVGG